MIRNSVAASQQTESPRVTILGDSLREGTGLPSLYFGHQSLLKHLGKVDAHGESFFI